MSPREPWYTRVNAWGLDRIHAARRRWTVVDHLFRAGGRYRRTQGDLTAAGVTYYAFLGLFPVLLLAASVIGLVLSGNVLLQEQLFETIREAFPGAVGEELVRQLENAIDDAGFIGLIALVGFVYAGLRTIDNLRLGMERIWKGHVDDPDVFRDNLADLVALLTLGGLGLASLGITAGVTQATSWVLDVLGIADEPINGLLTKVVGIGLAVVADVVVFLWLLRVVPSVSVPLLRLLPGALFGAAGFEVLKLLGGVYLAVISRSVTASAFGGAVGLLVWINVVARFSFFTAAWTATLRSVEAATPLRWSLTPVTTPADESPVGDRSGSSRR